MSADYEIAIEEGATLVRVGRRSSESAGVTAVALRGLIWADLVCSLPDKAGPDRAALSAPTRRLATRKGTDDSVSAHVPVTPVPTPLPRAAPPI